MLNESSKKKSGKVLLEWNKWNWVNKYNPDLEEGLFIYTNDGKGGVITDIEEEFEFDEGSDEDVRIVTNVSVLWCEEDWETEELEFGTEELFDDDLEPHHEEWMVSYSPEEDMGTEIYNALKKAYQSRTQLTKTIQGNAGKAAPYRFDIHVGDFMAWEEKGSTKIGVVSKVWNNQNCQFAVASTDGATIVFDEEYSYDNEAKMVKMNMRHLGDANFNKLPSRIKNPLLTLKNRVIKRTN